MVDIVKDFDNIDWIELEPIFVGMAVWDLGSGLYIGLGSVSTN